MPPIVVALYTPAPMRVVSSAPLIELPSVYSWIPLLGRMLVVQGKVVAMSMVLLCMWPLGIGSFPVCSVVGGGSWGPGSSLVPCFWLSGGSLCRWVCTCFLSLSFWLWSRLPGRSGCDVQVSGSAYLWYPAGIVPMVVVTCSVGLVYLPTLRSGRVTIAHM